MLSTKYMHAHDPPNTRLIRRSLHFVKCHELRGFKKKENTICRKLQFNSDQTNFKSVQLDVISKLLISCSQVNEWSAFTPWFRISSRWVCEISSQFARYNLAGKQERCRGKEPQSWGWWRKEDCWVRQGFSKLKGMKCGRVSEQWSSKAKVTDLVICCTSTLMPFGKMNQLSRWTK